MSLPLGKGAVNREKIYGVFTGGTELGLLDARNWVGVVGGGPAWGQNESVSSYSVGENTRLVGQERACGVGGESPACWRELRVCGCLLGLDGENQQS